MMKFKIEYTTKSNPLGRKPAKRFWTAQNESAMVLYFKNHPELILLSFERVK